MKLPHTVTLLRATVLADRKNVTQEDWTTPVERERPAFVQPRASTETHDPQREQVRSSHVMFCLEPDILPTDRVTWQGATYLIVGQPARHETPAGYHHTEADLLIVAG